MSMFHSYLLLGANLGDRFKQLEAARQAIQEQVGRILQASAVYETQAWGVSQGPAYLNQVLLVETFLAPEQLLTRTGRIEALLGRTRTLKWESRLIDIDILFYEQRVMNTADLVLPHPHLHKRKFTLVPLVELAPDLLHPVLKKTSRQLLNELQDPLEVRKI